MKFDSLGLPQDNGATDLQDSARLAGIMTVFGWPQKIPLREYIKEWKYVRHPLEYKYDFSRDQAICYLAGLGMQENGSWIQESCITGKDLLSPSVKGHFKRCKGLKANWFQDVWLRLDILVHANISPISEPNQLLCMMLVHPDKKYLKYWCKINRYWDISIREYWCGWRGESELGKFMIQKIKTLIQEG